MKKPLLLTLFFLVCWAKFDASAQCGTAQQCAYSFIMSDSYGDSWNGNTMIVVQNGVTVATLTGPTTANGTSPVNVSISLCDGQPFQLHWNQGGSWPSEVGISIVNSFGQTIYNMDAVGNGSQNTTIFDGTSNCASPICYPPNDLFATAMTSTSTSFFWVQDDDTSQWEVIVAPITSDAPTAESNGTIVNTSAYDAVGLVSNSTYMIYVRSRCSAITKSDWISLQFTPTCFTPFELNAQSLTSTQPLLSWSQDGTATEFEVYVAPAMNPAPTSLTSGVSVSAMSYAATGLTAGTTYKFYVRAVCGAGDFSNWSAGYTFTPTVTLPPLYTNTTLYTPQQLVTSILVNNPCISISNVTSSTGTNFGSVNGIGFFTNTNATFPLSSGIILSSGNALSAPGPNTSTLSEGAQAWAGDTQLEAIISAATGEPMESHNATRLEFDFTSLNEYMSFNFLFSSDEYGTYQCAYADAFAFLLTDLTTGITTNLAVVPGTTTPVSVVTIRDAAYNNACVSMNPGFFDTYYEGNTVYTSAVNYNGQTALMTASSAIIPGNPYHIKMVVADRGDNAYDSSVFIQAGSFSSGPPACSDKVQLVAFIDSNSNGVKDVGENEFNYGHFTSELNNDGVINNITTPLGIYTHYDSNPSNIYEFGYQVDAEYAPYYNAAPTNFDNISIPVGSGTQTLYFPILLTQGYSDVQVIIVPVTPPVAGNTFINRIQYTNLGVTPASGSITFSKDPAVTVIQTSPPGAVVTATGFTYMYANLLPYESRTIDVTMSVPAIPAVNIDDVLTTNAVIDAGEGDLFNANNAFTNQQIVVASYDPNDKMEAHGGKIPINHFAENDYLYYTIRFQNTGTSNAIFVRIEDTLDAMLDEQSVRVVSASHDYIMKRVGNQLIWNFDYIQLPPLLQDEAASQGYVIFKIRLKPGYTVGDIIPNYASIYFDSNPAIVTNTFDTEFIAALAAVEYTSGDLVMYPNPVSSTLNLRLLNGSDHIDTIVIYDIVGKNIINVKPTDADAVIDVSALSKGVYLVEITTGQSKQVRKLVIN